MAGVCNEKKGMKRFFVDKTDKPITVLKGEERRHLADVLRARVGDTVEEKPLPVVHAEPFAFYKNFAAACAGKEQKKIKKEEVLRVFRLMEAAALSARKNSVINKNI